MKKALVVLFSLVFASAVMAADATVAGSWRMESEVVGNASVAIITFKQEGAKLTGTTQNEGDEGEPQAITGKVEGNKITWSTKAEWAGNELTIVYTGTVGADGVISGSVEVQPMGVEGEFTAKRAEKK